MRKIPKVILLIETSREFGRELLRGIARYSRIHGPWAFYREPSGLLGKMPDLRKWHADGIIVRGDAVKPEEIRELGIPAVFSPRRRRHVPDFPCIIVDSMAAGRIGAEYLLGRGFKHFAFCGFSDMPWSKERAEGFSKRVGEAGFKAYFHEQPESLSGHSWMKEQDLISDWLKSLPKPVAMMACTDYCGQHVLESCKMVGLHIPEEVSVLGVLNDDIICDLCDPPLSSIALNIERGGYEAAELLDKMMAGEKVTEQVIIQPTRVVTRQSTDVLAIEDRAVLRALHFIRKRANELIQVTDVVDAVELSRRNLEQRFRRVLGRSVLSEIRRMHVEHISRLLEETNMSVVQIASALGYTSEKHIARLFRREKGLSPLAYRKKCGHRGYKPGFSK